MSSLSISFFVFLCTTLGAGLGIVLQNRLPGHHMSQEGKETIKVSVGMIATLTALVLGLLVAAAKDSYDTRNNEFRESMADIILLDRVLKHYGEPAAPARAILKRTIDQLVLAESTQAGIDTPAWDSIDVITGIEDLQDALRALVPATSAQTWLQNRALEVSGSVAKTRWLLVEQSETNIQTAFVIVLIFWLATIFASFGLFAPRNLTSVLALILCAIAVAGAVEMVLELEQPFGGLIRISPEPLRHAVQVLSL